MPIAKLETETSCPSRYLISTRRLLFRLLLLTRVRSITTISIQRAQRLRGPEFLAYNSLGYRAFTSDTEANAMFAETRFSGR